MWQNKRGVFNCCRLHGTIEENLGRMRWFMQEQVCGVKQSAVPISVWVKVICLQETERGNHMQTNCISLVDIDLIKFPSCWEKVDQIDNLW